MGAGASTMGAATSPANGPRLANDQGEKYAWDWGAKGAKWWATICTMQ